jgi:transcriptional regulator of met regulon
MGADVLFRFRTGKGSLVVATEKGIYVGPAGRPGMARVMIPSDTESGLKAGVYEVESRNLQQFKAIIPTKTGKGTSAGTRKDKFGRPVKTLADSKLPTVEDLVSKVQNITDEDRRLAKGELSPAEREAELDGRDKSPIADLPAGFEAENPEKVKELLRETGIEPDDFDPSKKAKSKNKPEFKPPVDERRIQTADPKELSDEELKQRIKFDMLRAPADPDMVYIPDSVFEAERRGLEITDAPSLFSKKDSIDDAVSDVMGKVAFGDDVPDVDSLIKFAKSPPKDPDTPTTKKRFPIELEPGMVVRQQGTNLIVQDTPKRAGSTKDGRNVTTFNYTVEGNKNVQVARVDGSIPLDVVVGSDGRTPIKRDVVSPEVAKPATPETPSKPNTPKKPTPRKSRINELSKKFKDDGKDIAPAKKSREELYDKVIANEIDPETGELLLVPDINGKPRPINSPNAIEDAIFEETPGAKIRPDGAIVVERSTFVDTDGQKYKYEIRVERTIGNQFMERYVFSNPETGEVVHDFYNNDYKDSFSSLYGKANGLVVTRDYFLGRTVPGKKGVDASGVPNDKEKRSYFGPTKTIANRIKYLKKIDGANRMPRINTPTENMRKFLDGYGRLVNKSDSPTGEGTSTLGTIARGYVADIYEIVAGGDSELIAEAFKQAMGRMPNNPEATTALLSEFREGLRKRFAGTPAYKSIIQLPKQLAMKLVDEDLDLNDPLKIPFVSQDGVSILAPGRYVKFFNNENGFSIGRVTRLVAGSGKNGNYKDTVVVQFADKSVPNLQTRNMSPLTDDELDLTVINNDNLLTPYVPQLEGEEMRQVRLGIDYRDALNRKEDSPDDGPDDILDSGDAGAPYLGSDGQDGEDSSGDGGGIPVEELTPGDSLYSSDGEFLGTVVDVQEVPSADGGAPGYAVTYLTPEGEEDVDVLDAGEVRSPK